MTLKISKFQNVFEDKMEPGSFIGAVFIASGVKNSVIVYHGYLGCNIEAIHMRSDTIPGGYYTPIIATGLNESDSIYGGSDKLSKTLDKVCSEKYQFIWILTGDATSITADDIYSHVNFYENNYNVTIIPVDSPGFIGGIAKGTDLALSSFFKKVSISEERLFGVDLFCPHLMGIKSHNQDITEVSNLLHASGIPVNNVFSKNIQINDSKKISLSENHLFLTWENLTLTEKFLSNKSNNIINRPIPLPIGVANTEKWLFDIAGKFDNLDLAQKVLIDEKQILDKQLKYNYNFSWLSSLYNEKSCSIYGNPIFAASMALCLYYDFNIIPKVVSLISESDVANDIGVSLLGEISDFVDINVLINPDYYSYVQEIEKNSVDFAVGSVQDKSLCVGRGIPHMNLAGYYFFNNFNFIPWPYFGIKGILSILTELGFLMEKIFYNEESWKKFSYNS